MNQYLGWLLAAGLAAAPLSQGLPTLTDSEVQAALDIGLDGNEINKVRRYCDARAGFGETLGESLISTGTTTLGKFRVTVSSNIGEIALIAREKKRRYQPVGLEDVPAHLREPAAFISIAPLGDSAAYDGQLDLPSMIEHVIVRPQGDKEGAVQPLAIQMDPTYLQNLFGAVIAANTAVVAFPADAIYEIAQNDDVEIVVITVHGERKCDIGDDDVRRMFDLDGRIRAGARAMPAATQPVPTPQQAPPPPPATTASVVAAKPPAGSTVTSPPAAATPPATSTSTSPPPVATPPATESKPPKAEAAPAATERISAGALPPAPAAISAPEKVSGSASWTARTASGVAYEWSAEIRNPNGEPMNAVVTIVLRASDGSALHTAQGAGSVPPGASTALSGTGVVADSLATRADHWTIDVAWGELEQSATTPSPSPGAAPAAAPPAPHPTLAATVSVSLTVNLTREEARITNTGNTDIDLRGWELVSVTGDQRMKFATGFLNPGGSITVTSGARARNSPGYYQWTIRTVWEINGDPAELYDAEGNLKARTDASGKPRR